tara:strand:- start:67 stop:894 length:828 start_codon:yes stop_codon:yes gene_type:complete
MIFNDIFGAWIAVFFTLAIFSFLYKDNPFYKIAEHAYIGISAGYWLSIGFWTIIQPNLLGRLWPSKEYSEESFWYSIYDFLGSIIPSIFPNGGIDKGHNMDLTYLIPLVLGIMMILSIFKQFNWMARWGIAYTVAIAAGLRAYGYLNSYILGQIKGTIVPLANTKYPIFHISEPSLLNNLLILLGTVTGLLYFFFSREQSGSFGKITRLGIYFLMISFGASFGFAVMGRISLLIGRFVSLIDYSNSQYHHATLWVLFLMTILLIYSAINDRSTSS